jgi:hypothetical protein
MRFCEFNKCKYPVFGTDKNTGIGYCRSHQFLRTDIDKRSIIQKAISKNVSKNEISKVRRLKSMEENLELVNKKKELDEWFVYHMQNSKKVCENCGADLSHYNKKDWYGSQHHIIEKSPTNGCPSVAAELLNHGVLGKWCCHPQWHTSYSNAQKMPFFKIAVERFKTFEDKIIEKSKIPECFKEAIKNYKS